MMLNIPTEPIGSIPRPDYLLKALLANPTDLSLEPLYDQAVCDTVHELEATGSPVISDGEQRKYHNFATYAVHGLENLAPDGFRLQFINHYRQWPRLTKGPFLYVKSAHHFLKTAKSYAHVPVKQAVISPSALSLLYPVEPLKDYCRDQFIEDLLNEHEQEVRSCLQLGAHAVQIDFTEGRLAYKLDPTGELLTSFIQLNNLALDRFNEQERSRIGIHTCPGGDCDSTHSLDVDYSELLPTLFELNVGKFYISLAREPDRQKVLTMIKRYLRPNQIAFVGVIDVLDPRIETPDEVCERVLEAAQYIPLEQLGTTDDCGFAPFCDDISTSRETAFAKIKARVDGTLMASRMLGLQQCNTQL
jgi:5-methyltetrahydropteroyltriglutamate--homocysteine methyltransferase